eukprot:637872-Pyramimonas_sp.AAC.1
MEQRWMKKKGDIMANVVPGIAMQRHAEKPSPEPALNKTGCRVRRKELDGGETGVTRTLERVRRRSRL